jgi:hypothetical protein
LDIDDFELVEEDEFNAEEYKHFEERSLESKCGFFDSNIIFQSNYFKTGSTVSGNTFDARLSTEMMKETVPVPTNKTKNSGTIDKKMPDAESSDDSLSSDEDDDEEMAGTLYFMDHKNTRFKGIFENNKTSDIKDRRLSLDGNILINPMPMLQTSSLVHQVNMANFSQFKWKEIFGIIQHKALI